MESRGLTVTHIIDTHGHPDQTSANALMKNITEVPICIHEDDEMFLIHTNWLEELHALHPEVDYPKCGKINSM